MPVFNDEIVIDPQVPERARHALSAAGSRLIPYRQSMPPKPVPPAPVTGRRALIWGVLALVFLIGAVLAGASGSLGYVVLLLIVAGVATAGAVLSGFRRHRREPGTGGRAVEPSPRPGVLAPAVHRPGDGPG